MMNMRYCQHHAR